MEGEPLRQPLRHQSFRPHDALHARSTRVAALPPVKTGAPRGYSMTTTGPHFMSPDKRTDSRDIRRVEVMGRNSQAAVDPYI